MCLTNSLSWVQVQRRRVEGCSGATKKISMRQRESQPICQRKREGQPIRQHYCRRRLSQLHRLQLSVSASASTAAIPHARATPRRACSARALRPWRRWNTILTSLTAPPAPSAGLARRKVSCVVLAHTARARTHACVHANLKVPPGPRLLLLLP